MEPGVGGPSGDYRAVCAYTGSRDGEHVCGEPAAVHLMVNDPAWGTIGLAACDRHAPVARVAGVVLGEHEHSGLCGLPGTFWHLELNRCVIDDSGVEPVLVTQRLVTAQ